MDLQGKFEALIKFKANWLSTNWKEISLWLSNNNFWLQKKKAFYVPTELFQHTSTKSP